MRATPPRFGIAGWKNSGKTTMTASLAQALTELGYRVATIKHAHENFDIDQPGTDSHAHRLAGASEVALVSPRRWALMHENDADEPEATLDDIIDRLSPCDVVLIEGFKAEHHPKIEMRLAAQSDRPALADADPAVIAIAYDVVPEDVSRIGHPVFQRDQISAIAHLVMEVCDLDGESLRRAARP